MTVYFPDVSAFQAGISLAGAPAAAIKATEGTSWASSDYGPAIRRARTAGCFAMAYHFQHAGSAGRFGKYLLGWGCAGRHPGAPEPPSRRATGGC